MAKSSFHCSLFHRLSIPFMAENVTEYHECKLSLHDYAHFEQLSIAKGLRNSHDTCISCNVVPLSVRDLPLRPGPSYVPRDLTLSNRFYRHWDFVYLQGI